MSDDRRTKRAHTRAYAPMHDKISLVHLNFQCKIIVKAYLVCVLRIERQMWCEKGINRDKLIAMAFYIFDVIHASKNDIQVSMRWWRAQLDTYSVNIIYCFAIESPFHIVDCVRIPENIAILLLGPGNALLLLFCFKYAKLDLYAFAFR